jgi:hypothetical protein
MTDTANDSPQQPGQQIPVDRYIAQLEARHGRAMSQANSEIAQLSTLVDMLREQLTELAQSSPVPVDVPNSPAVAPTARTNGRAPRR